MVNQVDEHINKLLAVPYSSVYSINEKLMKQLEKDFFTECFITPSYGISENIHKLNEPIKTAFEIDLPMKELLDSADTIRNNENAFLNWLNNQKTNVYYVRGDAGTGKTAYLHWQKYRAEEMHPEAGWKWKILDLAEARDSVKILDISVNIPNFNRLNYKVISAIIQSIDESLYPEKANKKPIDHKKTATRFQTLSFAFQKNFDQFYPDHRIRQFFLKLPLKTENEEDKTSRRISEDCGRFMAQRFKDILDRYNGNEALSLIFQMYFYILRCLDNQSKFVVAIDNVERIIGSDEIFNVEITEFAATLRTIQNSIAENNASLQQFYKLVVFMRNTSVRMLTPQQITDIRASTLDISDWFDVEAIIQKKLCWYEKQGEKLEAADEVLHVLQDNFNDDGNLRGLYTKLKMIFNNNKRVIIHFLIHVFGKKSNQPYIDIFNQLREHKVAGLTESLTRFATRSIIYRLLLNEMRQDDFFRAIMTVPGILPDRQRDGMRIQQENDYGTAALGYARRILTLAYEYKLRNPEDPYMALSDILCALFNLRLEDIDQFYSVHNSERRKIISEVLFAMNYYDGRKGDWLQFIDIQYYPEGMSKSTRIPDKDKMNEILEQGIENINIKITTAGVAYLYFIAFSYEYFSCKSIYSSTRREIIGEYDIPPLLCTIPTKEQIVNSRIMDMECIKTIEVVLIETLRCIIKMNRDDEHGFDTIPFRWGLDTAPVKHTIRITNSHRGYLDNYVECLSAIFDQDARDDKLFKMHLDLLIEAIQEIRNYYQYDANDDIDRYKSNLQALLNEIQRKKDELRDK